MPPRERTGRRRYDDSGDDKGDNDDYEDDYDDPVYRRQMGGLFTRKPADDDAAERVGRVAVTTAQRA